MPLSPASIRIVSAPPDAVVRIAGRAAAERARDFDSAIRCLAASGVRHVYLDLRDCPLLDSTFAGTLALLAEAETAPKPPVQFTLVEARPRIVDSLANLEVLPLLRVAEPGAPLPCDGPGQEVPPGKPSHQEAGRTCLDAHRALMQLSDANRARFKDLESALASELDKDSPR